MNLTLMRLIVLMLVVGVSACGGGGGSSGGGTASVGINSSLNTNSSVGRNSSLSINSSASKNSNQSINSSEATNSSGVSTSSGVSNSSAGSTGSEASGNTYLGQSIYKQQCVGCHGDIGQGIKPAPALLVSNFTDFTQMQHYIRDAMPPVQTVAGTSPSDCDETCARHVSAYIFNAFKVNEKDLPSQSQSYVGSVTRRFSADMLEASLSILMGHNIKWQLSGRSDSAFDSLSDTLGKPDYIEITEEARLPTTLYVKLTGDMARNVCQQAVDADYRLSSVTERALIRVPNLSDIKDSVSINKNLRYLKLRLHGEFIAEQDIDATTDLRTIFNTVAAVPGSDAKKAWQAVCVAMLSAPEFHLY